MRYEIIKSEVHVEESLHKAIGQKADKIEKRLKRFHPETAHLEIKLFRIEKLKEFECALQLKALRNSFHSKKSAPELRVAVDKSFDAIMRELDHYKLKITKSAKSGT